ncbi:MAG TPA: hypothetical protein DEV64_01765 [Rhodospirillaceae bacterium]|nr:hypothetical protein [Rhodospirillaceae bacterium]|tara:strand:+ start:1888 stop:2091 length:204 start_codon:yes stop_codon:yes gene_type:complete
MVHDRVPFVLTTNYVGLDGWFQKGRVIDFEQIDMPKSGRDSALSQFNAAASKKIICVLCQSIDGQKT